MNTIQKLLNDIQHLTQKQSLSLIERDIALEKTKILYENISNLPTQKTVESQAAKPTEIKIEPIIESEKNEPKKQDSKATHSATETIKTESLKHESSTESLNDILNKNRKTELADKLEHSPIKDLKSIIGFNDKFSFIQNLFAGNDSTYKNIIEQLNSFTQKTDAEKLLDELSIKNNWNENEEIAEQFKEIINRKFL
jgi:hypothetical protein